jgi:hypothetical protein
MHPCVILYARTCFSSVQTQGSMVQDKSSALRMYIYVLLCMQMDNLSCASACMIAPSGHESLDIPVITYMHATSYRIMAQGLHFLCIHVGRHMYHLAKCYFYKILVSTYTCVNNIRAVGYLEGSWLYKIKKKA